MVRTMDSTCHKLQEFLATFCDNITFPTQVTRGILTFCSLLLQYIQSVLFADLSYLLLPEKIWSSWVMKDNVQEKGHEDSMKRQTMTFRLFVLVQFKQLRPTNLLIIKENVMTNTHHTKFAKVNK